MRKIRPKASAAALLALAGMMLCAPGAWAQAARVHCDGTLNMRSQPSTDSASLGAFYCGAQVEIVADAGNGWSEVSIGGSDGVSGYMKSEYLATLEQMNDVRDSTYDAFVVSPYGTQSIVLRDAPSDSYSAVAMLSVGESVRVIGESGTFYYVLTGSNAVGCLADDEIDG